MQALAATHHVSDPLVARHFNQSAALYVDHDLEVYRRSVHQRLDLLSRCIQLSSSDEIKLLDIGCGGGTFLDIFLERFPAGHATGVDISSEMLSRNRPSCRKTLVEGDALTLARSLGEFDAISIDTVMHHLIAREGYGATIDRIRGFLQSLHALMRPGGVIVIREIYHEFRVRAALGCRTIYELSTLKVPAALERGMKMAGLQTANVGVCFLTRAQWQQLFTETGFTVTAMEDHAWQGQPYRRFGFAQSGDLHFVLTRTRPQL